MWRRAAGMGMGVYILAAGALVAAEPMELEVMSFNIRYGTASDGDHHWDHRREHVIDLLRERAPDVIGLQEALRFQIDEIRAGLPGYGELGQGRDGGTEGEYSAILYRTDRFRVMEAGDFWLSETPEVPSIHWGNACVRMCTWARFEDRASSRRFYLYNTHLDHVSQPSREQGARLILDRIHNRAHPDPFVLTGDFNAGEENPAIRLLTAAPDSGDRPPPMVDSFRVLHPDATEVGTFSGFTGRTDGAKIDYVFVAPDIRVIAADILRDQRQGATPSDHFPVTARIRFPAAPPNAAAP